MNRATLMAKGFAGLLFVFCLAVSPAMAQEESGVEIGVDGMLVFRLYDDANPDDAFLMSLPVKLRAGFPVSTRFSMEPSLAFDIVSVGGYTRHEFDLGLSFLRDLGGEPGKTAPFLRVGGSYHLVGSNYDTNGQFSASGTVGVRLPMANRLDFRVEAGVTRHFVSDFYIDSWDVGSLFGLSFYTQ